MDDTVDRRPLYRRLHDQLAAEIARHTWRPGQAIPTETELAATYRVAVGTVRKAVDALVAEGLLVREQGRGTFVRRPSFDNSLFRFFWHQGKGGSRVIPDSRILEREILAASPAVASALRIPPASCVLRLSRLRLFSGIPTLLEEICLPADHFGALLTMPEVEIGALLYPVYESRFGASVARAEESLTVGTAAYDEVLHLGLAQGQAIVVIERLAFGYDDKPIEWRRSRGAASTFRYHVEIR